MASQPHLALRALSKSFAGRPVLKGIDLEIQQGGFVSLLGPSGCGKTTTLRCVAGFEFPDSGEILFKNENIALRDPAKRNFGMVFQSYALFPHLTVHENISFGLEMRRVNKVERDQRIARMLELVQLRGKEDSYPRQLSGGQQQRVALARAIAFEPDVLLLDEPLANLDAVLRDEMRYFIREIQKRLNLTAVYVTHDQAEAMAMSDQIVVMFDGEIAQKGSPTAVYGAPASRRVASFIGRANFLEGTVERRGQGGQHLIATKAGPVLASAPGPVAEGATVTVLIRPEDIAVSRDASASREEGPDPGNVFQTKIVKTVYHGSQWEITCETADGTQLSTFVSNQVGECTNATVFLSINASRCQVLAR
ncbi:ABC transporter ATP-binding protein [Pseudochelatococcus sp. B33]